MHRSMIVAVTLVVASAAAAFVPGVLRAAPGDLDPTFGTSGRVITDFGPGSNRAAAVAIQSDGKIVASGGSGSGHFALARYTADGSLDPSFGVGGKVTTVVGGVFESANALALGPDGKIVAAGGTAPGGYCCQFAVARYNADGSLDSGFAGDGTVTTSFGGNAQASAVAVQSDGKLVAAGSRYDPFGSGFALVRYNSDGSLDSSFGTGGTVTTSFGGPADRAAGLAIQGDRKIVVVGAGGSGNDFVVARYTATGALDPSFGAGGSVTTDFGSYDGASAVTLQLDGKIVVAGIGAERFALARYTSDGTLDSSFGSGGKATTQFFGENIESANAVALQQNGKIVTVGSAFHAGEKYAIARFAADGTLDASFGSGGKLTTDFGDPQDVGFATGMAIQSDGKIVAVGGGGPCTPACEWTMARYLGDPTTTQVTIDIKPGSSENPVNLAAKGRIPVAILTTEAFDATTVDPRTVCFGDSGDPSQGDCSAEGTHIEDVNGDGRADLVLQFTTAATGIQPGDTTACLIARTIIGIAIEGCDSIKTL